MERDFNVNWVTRCSKINRRVRVIDAFHCVDISKEDDNEVELENDQQHMQDLWEEFEVLDCGNGANKAKNTMFFMYIWSWLRNGLKSQYMIMKIIKETNIIAIRTQVKNLYN